MFSCNRIISREYIPPRVYFGVIEPTLNNRLMMSTLKDKNYYELYFDGVQYPKVLFRRVNNFYYDASYRLISSQDLLRITESAAKLIVKPSLDSGSGQSIRLFHMEDGVLRSDNTIFDDRFLKSYNHDFVAQEVVTQHSFYKQFNETSNNTIRVLVYRSVSDDSINILHTMLRIGKKGSFMDHENLGGITVAIDNQGRLKDTGYDAVGRAYPGVGGIEFSKSGYAVGIEHAWDSAYRIAARSYYGRLLALDFTINEAGTALLLDVNCWRNGTTQYQISNGTLFGSFTKEVLDYCVGHKAYNLIRIPLI
jgi:hypothetical protein